MKHVLSVLLCLFVATALTVQAQQFDWARGGGGSANDATRAVAIGSDGSVYVAGTFKGSATFGTWSPTVTLTAHAPYDVDIFVAKYSPAGSLIWAVSAGGNVDEDVSAIGVDANNTVHIAGNFSVSAQFGALTAAGQGGKDVYIATLRQSNIGLPTESAAFRNVCAIAGTGADSLRGMAVAADGSTYILAAYTGTATIATPTSLPVTLNAMGGAADMDMVITRLDDTLAPVWKVNAGTASPDAPGLGIGIDVARNRLFFSGTAAGLLKVGTVQSAVSGVFLAQLDLSGAVGNVKALSIRKTGTFVVDTTGNVVMLSFGTISVFKGATCDQIGSDLVLPISGTVIAFNEVENAYVIGGLIAQTTTIGSTVLTVPSGVISSYVAQYSTTGTARYARLLGAQTAGTGSSALAVAARAGNVAIAGSYSGLGTFGTATILGGGLADGFVTRIIPGNWISGIVFADNNGNNVQDANEPGRAGALIQVGTSNPDYYATFGDGTFLIPVGAGTTTLSAVAAPYHTVAPLTHTATFSTATGGSATGKAFGMIPVAGHNDVRVAVIGNGYPRPGFNVTYSISLEDIGTTQTGSMTLHCTFDTALGAPTSIAPPATSVAGNTITWSGLSFDPDELRMFDVSFAVPVSIAIGSTVNVSANVDVPVVFVDEAPGDNAFALSQKVRASHDPNDKLVLPEGDMTPAQVAAMPWISYTIRFQNTGTAPATDVVVRDTLSSHLAWSTLQTVASSDPYTIEGGGHGAVAWRFTNINLADSATNEPASHGFVTFRILPQSGLVVGDSIRNRASIYFDFNTPVVTAYAVTRIAQRPPITRRDTLTGANVAFSVPNHVGRAFKIANRKVPASVISTVDLQFIPAVPGGAILSSALRIDSAATAWSAPYRHIDAGAGARDSITFVLGLPDSVGYTGVLSAVVRHQDGDSLVLQIPVVVQAAARAQDSMVVQTATTGDAHLSGRAFHIRNTATPASPIVAVDIRFSPQPVYPPTGSNLSADGSTLIWNAPFDHIALTPVVDSLSFDLALADSNDWSGNVTIVVHHTSGDSSVLRYGPWTIQPGAVSDGAALPAGFVLRGVDPNPASANATVRFVVGASARVRLDVINALGERVKVITDEMMSAREATASIDTRDLSPGVYWVRMMAGRGAAMVRMVVVR